jgi:CubicO group peptidase (beta-lactamase class C family)
MNRLRLVGVFLLLCMCSNAVPEAASANWQTKDSQTVIIGAKGKQIDELLQAYHSEGLLNGVVLVAERGKIIYKRGFGFANMEFNVPNEPNTKFRIASISKPIVALLAMRLIEQGKLSLDAKVSNFLPDYRKDIADKVTVRHLLSHTSGIPDTLIRPGLWEREIRDPFTTQELLARYSNGALQFEPGTKTKYGTMNYVLLSLMIEKAIGKSFEQAMREYIFEPVGMRDTGIEGASPTVEGNAQGRTVLKGATPVIERLATGYIKTNNGFTRAPFMDMTHAAVGGAMHSTVEDLYLLDRALYEDKFLSKSSRDVLFTPVLEDIALGWNVRHLSFADLQQPFLNIVDPSNSLRPTPADFKVAYKLGDVWGFTGIFARHVNEQHTVIILVNGNMRGVYFDLDPVRMWQAITSILYEKPYFTPRERMFAEIIERQGFDRAVQTFKQLKQKEPSSPIIKEAEFNAIGYEFLGKQKIAQAISIFRLNVEAHPNSANVYDSLGEGYMMNGEKELAIKSYEKSLELDPKNTNAVEMLKKLRGK